MTDAPPSAPPPTTPAETPREERLRREARALRDNLLRRKAQARGRAAPPDPTAMPPPLRED